jgi:hypothetical protein
MEQVRETVRQVGRALSPQDRFGVVSFDTMVCGIVIFTRPIHSLIHSFYIFFVDI